MPAAMGSSDSPGWDVCTGEGVMGDGFARLRPRRPPYKEEEMDFGWAEAGGVLV